MPGPAAQDHPVTVNPSVSLPYSELKEYLDALVDRFERVDFIDADPIAVPHGFDDPRDREVIGLYAAILAWGRRQTILDKMAELCERMDYRPYRFVYDFAKSGDAGSLAGFKHRTFQPEDAYWLTHNLGLLLRRYGSVEQLFARHLGAGRSIHSAIEGFSNSLLTEDAATPARLKKHLARPSTGSACKRLNMYLRWMVRPGPVDFGAWSAIEPSELVLPLDVHSGRQARELGLVERRADDWRAAMELTENCRRLDPDDPARYDFAFFGAGVYGVSLDARFTGANKLTSIDSPSDR